MIFSVLKISTVIICSNFLYIQRVLQLDFVLICTLNCGSCTPCSYISFQATWTFPAIWLVDKFRISSDVVTRYTRKNLTICEQDVCTATLEPAGPVDIYKPVTDNLLNCTTITTKVVRITLYSQQACIKSAAGLSKYLEQETSFQFPKIPELEENVHILWRKVRTSTSSTHKESYKQASTSPSLSYLPVIFSSIYYVIVSKTRRWLDAS